MSYKKLLIQQQKFDGSAYINVGSVIDTQKEYHVVCQEFPFKMMPETKELAKREWYDEHGDDVFIPSDGLKFKAYDLEVKFIYVGTEDTMQGNIGNFIRFLYGLNYGGSPLLAVYDEYTKTGRRGIYVEGVDNDLFAYDDANVHVVAVFKVKFRVTDPVTEIVLSYDV